MEGITHSTFFFVHQEKLFGGHLSAVGMTWDAIRKLQTEKMGVMLFKKQL